MAASEKFVEVFQNATQIVLPCLVTLEIKRLVEGKMVYYRVSKVIVVDFHPNHKKLIYKGMNASTLEYTKCVHPQYRHIKLKM